jgi:hypothetical protein
LESTSIYYANVAIKTQAQIYHKASVVVGKPKSPAWDISGSVCFLSIKEEYVWSKHDLPALLLDLWFLVSFMPWFALAACRAFMFDGLGPT